MRRLAAAFLATVVLAVAGCGADDDGARRGELVVSAATSLTTAFERYGEAFDDADVQFSFAGSDELAAQIRSGARPDVFASANTRLPQQLAAEGLVERPRVFTRNTLVLAVPAGDDARVGAIGDLADDGVTLAIGAESVPVGAYTRTVLGRLAAGQRRAILANVRSEEPNVGGIAAKLTQGAVDAGFLYATDVTATNGRLKAIALPARLQPDVAYGVALVTGGANPDAARAFVDGLLDGAGADALRAAGFEAPAAG